jgi:hypothetical protein
LLWFRGWAPPAHGCDAEDVIRCGDADAETVIKPLKDRAHLAIYRKQSDSTEEAVGNAHGDVFASQGLANPRQVHVVDQQLATTAAEVLDSSIGPVRWVDLEPVLPPGLTGSSASGTSRSPRSACSPLGKFALGVDDPSQLRSQSA